MTPPARGRLRLRVLTMLDHALTLGGAEVLARRIVCGLDPARFEAILCGTRAETAPLVETEAAVTAAGVRFISLDRRSRTDVRSWARLVSLLRHERIDVLHTHKFGSNVWGAILGQLAQVPVIVAHEHTWSYEGRPVRRLLDREVIGRGVDALIAVSHADRRQMIEIEGIDPAIIRVIPNGIPSLPSPSRRDVRRELGIPAEAPVVGSVSVLRPQKALDVLIEAAAVLNSRFPDVRVLIAGHGPPRLRERERLEALIRERGLDETVMLLGSRPDVPDLLASFDVAVNSSDFEGTPLAVIEYMAAGKAIVATRVGGVPDLIDDHVHGLLVERRDVEALASAVGDLLRNPALRAELGERARERQRREFGIDVTIRRVEDLYEQLYAASARGRRVALDLAA